MGTRIEVAIKPDLPDPRGNRFLNRIQDDLGIRVSAIRILEVYNVDKPLDEDQQEMCRRELFTDPLTQQSSLGTLPGKAFDWMIEIGLTG
jgi:phosphoribosylformylglycinamidine synthase